MSQFAKGDLVKIVKTGEIARVFEVQGRSLIVQGISFTGRRSVGAHEVVDEYEYEREAGHYGLTPKGVQPPAQGGN